MKGGRAMHFLLENSCEHAAADALRTLVMEAGARFPAVIAGKRSDGSRMQGAWVGQEGCTAYQVLDATDDRSAATDRIDLRVPADRRCKRL
jgi:hypothetical protein